MLASELAQNRLHDVIRSHSISYKNVSDRSMLTETGLEYSHYE